MPGLGALIFVSVIIAHALSNNECLSYTHHAYECYVSLCSMHAVYGKYQKAMANHEVKTFVVCEKGSKNRVTEGGIGLSGS